MATTADDWTWVKAFTAITTGGDIPIDIMTQSLGSLDVDIIASTIGNIPININQQGLGDITIDLNAQTIDRVTIRDSDGGVEASGSGDVNVVKETEETLHTYSGSGSFRYFMIQTAPSSSSEGIEPRIYIDTTLLHPHKSFSTWNSLGLTAVTKPYSILKYGVDSANVFFAYFEKGIVFDTSIKLAAYNNDGSDTVGVEGFWFYQKLT